jgi:hypothetical protein
MVPASTKGLPPIDEGTLGLEGLEIRMSTNVRTPGGGEFGGSSTLP